MKNIGKSLLHFFFGIPLEFPKKPKSAPGLPLAAGVVQSIYAPDFDQGRPLKLTHWHSPIDAIVTPNDVICEIESPRLTLELESLFHGKIVWQCPVGITLEPGTEICRIEGISIVLR